MKHTLLLLLATFLAYWWLHMPFLLPYSLQAFAVATLVYFLSKKLRNSSLTYLMPQSASPEMAIATFAFLLLIGSTGSIASPWYGFSYLYLFFLTFTTPLITSLTLSMVLVGFLYSLSPDLALSHWPQLLTIPCTMLVFEFSKRQYEALIKTQQTLQAATLEQQQLLESEEHNIATFLRLFLQPKLTQLDQLSQSPTHNQSAIHGQLLLMQLEIEKVLSQLEKSRQPSLAQPETPQPSESELQPRDTSLNLGENEEVAV